MNRVLLSALAAVISLTSPLSAAEKLKVLLIDGQNNHAWRETSPVLVSILGKSGRSR